MFGLVNAESGKCKTDRRGGQQQTANREHAEREVAHMYRYVQRKEARTSRVLGKDPKSRAGDAAIQLPESLQRMFALFVSCRSEAAGYTRCGRVQVRQGEKRCVKRKEERFEYLCECKLNRKKAELQIFWW